MDARCLASAAAVANVHEPWGLRQICVGLGVRGLRFSATRPAEEGGVLGGGGEAERRNRVGGLGMGFHLALERWGAGVRVVVGGRRAAHVERVTILVQQRVRPLRCAPRRHARLLGGSGAREWVGLGGAGSGCSWWLLLAAAPLLRGGLVEPERSRAWEQL